MRKNLQTLIRYVSLAAAAMLLAAGCAVSDLTIDTSDEAEVTYDGLYPVDGGTADAAWARPGADISKYSKIMLQGVGIEYRPGGKSGRLYHARRSDDHYEMSDKQKARLEELLHEYFLKELGESEKFTIVQEAGPDVLLIRGGLLDVVSFVPPEPLGREEIFLSRVGEATLVLDIRDSVSGAIIARAVDRRAAGDSANGLTRSNRVMNTAEVRQMIRAWAKLLRVRLDTYGGAGG